MTSEYTEGNRSEYTEGNSPMCSVLLSAQEDYSLPVTFSICLLAAALHQAAISTLFSGITFSWGNGCISGKHVGMVSPAITLEGLGPGKRRCLLKYKTPNWDELFQPGRHKSPLSTVTWVKTGPLLLWVYELSIRPVLTHTPWMIRLVLCFSETHMGHGTSSGTSYTSHTWGL